MVVGCDIRLSSEALKQATIRGLNDAGVNVLDLGMTGTEEVYFAAFHLDVQGGIEVTASHNPMDYNGMKLVRENARPISADTGLKEIQALAETNNFEEVSQKVQRKAITFCLSSLTIYWLILNLQNPSIKVSGKRG